MPCFNNDGPTRPPWKYHGRGKNWPVTVKIYGLDSPPPPCLASPPGGAGAAPDDGMDYDDAAFNDDGPTRPPWKYHGREKTWPVTVQICGLDSPPPPCLASPPGGACAAPDDGMDYDDAAFNDDGPTRPPRKYHGREKTGLPQSRCGEDPTRRRRRAWPRPRAGLARHGMMISTTSLPYSHPPLLPLDGRPQLCSVRVTCTPYRP